MNRLNLNSLVVVAVLVLMAMSFVFVGCHKDTTAPFIYFLAKDGVNIDKKGDTTILLFTKYVDPGCYVEDNASLSADIQVSSDLESQLPIERKIASHVGEVKKTGDYTINYTATDEAGNSGTRPKVVSVKNVSDIYAGRYWTTREEITGNSDVCQPAEYYSNITASPNVAGRIRFSKVAQHEYNGQKVSFKVDADLYSTTLSPRTRSDQVGFLGKAEDKEVAFYNGLSYDAAVDSMRMNYVYLQIPTQEASVAYTDGDAAINDYTVRIMGRMEGSTPKSMIVYDAKGFVDHIVLELSLTINSQAIQNYVEIYKPE